MVGFVYNPRAREAAELVAFLLKSLDLQGMSWVRSAVELDLDTETLARTSVIIAAGGDGTILRVVQMAAPASVPILGINMGRVGFMAELEVHEAEAKIPLYLEDNQRIQERMMLQATVTSRSDGEQRLTAHALNDVVVTRGALIRLLDIGVVIDGAPLATYRADGVIVATPTGSTGYALSTGGPVIYPEAKVMLIQPLAAHIRSLQTGLVVPGHSVCVLRVSEDDDAIISVDNIVDANLKPDDSVVIKRSPYVARFLRAGPTSAFYATLTRRLGVNRHA